MCERVPAPPDKVVQIPLSVSPWISLSSPSLSFPPVLFPLDFPVTGPLSSQPLSEASQGEAPKGSLALHNKHPDACWTMGLLANSHRHWLLAGLYKVWTTGLFFRGVNVDVLTMVTICCFKCGWLCLRVTPNLFCLWLKYIPKISCFKYQYWESLWMYCQN